MKTKAHISVSYFNKGKHYTNTFTTDAKDPQRLFDNAIQDANVWAQLHNGQVTVTRKIDSLYINYLEVNGYNNMERVIELNKY